LNKIYMPTEEKFLLQAVKPERSATHELGFKKNPKGGTDMCMRQERTVLVLWDVHEKLRGDEASKFLWTQNGRHHRKRKNERNRQQNPRRSGSGVGNFVRKKMSSRHDIDTKSTRRSISSWTLRLDTKGRALKKRGRETNGGGGENFTNCS